MTLKQKLLQDRVELVPQGFLVICPLCKNPLFPYQPIDMHESILTRGDIPKSKSQMLIFVKENCVLLHRVCHEVARSDAMQSLCIQHLILWEGLDSILSWLLEVKRATKSTQVDIKIRRVKSEYEIMSNLRGTSVGAYKG